MNTTLAQHLGGFDLQYSGYQVTNFSTKEAELAPVGPDVWEPAEWHQRIIATNGRFSVVNVWDAGKPAVASFEGFEPLIEWLKSNGKLSKPGSGPNVWD